MSGPGPMWARPQPLLRWLLPALLAALTFAFAAALTAPARADEAVPTATAGDVVSPIEQPGDQGPQGDPGPVPVDQLPQTDPPPPPDPSPPPEVIQLPPENPPAAPAEEHPQAVPDRGGDGGAHDSATQSASPSAESAPTTFTTVLQSPAIHAGVTAAPATTAPLGWDVYDDALFAEMIDSNANGFGGPGARAIGGFRVLSAVADTPQRDSSDDAKPASRAEPMSSGGSGPGGSGPGQGSSLGLFGGAGGSGAGMALLTLLGMASAWILIAPDRTRAFLTSTATWRLSNYVPPIERPG
jgi:hypothetical protein